MTWLKRVLMLLLAITLLLLGLWFGSENTQPVGLVVLGFSAPEVALGVLLIVTLLLGALLGFVMSVLPVLRLTNRNMSLERKLKRRDKELGLLRKAPIKSSALNHSRVAH